MQITEREREMWILFPGSVIYFFRRGTVARLWCIHYACKNERENALASKQFETQKSKHRKLIMYMFIIFIIETKHNVLDKDIPIM